MLLLDRFKNCICFNIYFDKLVRLKVVVSFISFCYLNWDELVRNMKLWVCFMLV